jgi:hypothetical protein
VWHALTSTTGGILDAITITANLSISQIAELTTYLAGPDNKIKLEDEELCSILASPPTRGHVIVCELGKIEPSTAAHSTYVLYAVTVYIWTSYKVRESSSKITDKEVPESHLWAVGGLMHPNRKSHK